MSSVKMLVLCVGGWVGGGRWVWEEWVKGGKLREINLFGRVWRKSGLAQCDRLTVIGQSKT